MGRAAKERYTVVARAAPCGADRLGHDRLHRLGNEVQRDDREQEAPKRQHGLQAVTHHHAPLRLGEGQDLGHERPTLATRRSMMSASGMGIRANSATVKRSSSRLLSAAADELSPRGDHPPG